MSWEEDWSEQGVIQDSVDIALASRSIATGDLKESLLKLSSVARRRACITLSTGSSPRVNENILTHLGLADALGRDFLYAFNILVHEGYRPEISYIKSTRKETFASFENAFELYSKMVRDAALNHIDIDIDALLQKLETWLHEHLIENPDHDQLDKKGLSEKQLCLDERQLITWAFIAWDTVK